MIMSTNSLKALQPLVLLLCLVGIAAGCRTGDPFARRWVHSFEEDSAGIRVYRPSTYRFPAADAREAWDFEEYGVARRMVIGAEGITSVDTLRWYLSEGDMLLITADESSRPLRYNVQQIDTSVLRLQVLR